MSWWYEEDQAVEVLAQSTWHNGVVRQIRDTVEVRLENGEIVSVVDPAMIRARSPEYPEHDKLRAVNDRSQVVGEFLDWLDGEGIRLARATETGLYDWILVRESPRELIAKFFEIDLNQIEREKRMMLAEQRLLNRRSGK